MKIISFHILSALLAFSLTSCNGQTSNASKSTSQTKSKNVASHYKEGQDYVEFKRARILDKVGFPNPVEAYSVLIPKNWSFQSEILWNAPGTICSGNNRSLKTTSPDGTYSFDYLPNYMWGFITDPQLAGFYRQQQYPDYCSYGEPMNAMEYFKNVFVPNELGNAKIIEVKENSEAQQLLYQQAEKNSMNNAQYGMAQTKNYITSITATVKLSPTQEALVTCSVIINENIIPNQYDGSVTKSYVTTATQRMVFKYPVGEKEKATNMLGVIVASFRTNTEWSKTVNEFWRNINEQRWRDHLGKLQMIDAQTAQMGRDAIKKGQSNLDAMDANMRNWEAKQASQDRMHTNFIKTIREVENYSDATGKVELSSGYNHAWSRSDGSSFIMSDNPNFDPSSVFQDQQWKEMRKVD